MTATIIITCAGYLLSVLPMFLLDITGSANLTALRSLAELLLVAQVTLNFAVYLASNKQYREAFRFFLGDLAGRLRPRCLPPTASQQARAETIELSTWHHQVHSANF